MIRVVTDSTSYIPSELLKSYNIAVVPLKVNFGQESFAEITGLSNPDFYRRLASSAVFPTTSQPASGEFKEVYQQILAEEPAAEILVLTISSKLSGTYTSAITAAQQTPTAKITVFDSLSAAMGLGLMAITAVNMAMAGFGMAEVVIRLEQMRRDTSIVFAVDTLEYLKRGGRIGAATAFLGTILNTKPILALANGVIQPVDRVRSRKRAIERLVKELEQKLPQPGHPVQAGVMHVAAETEMFNVVTLLQESFNITRLYTSELGPVVGAHLGPGALGVGICPEPQSIINEH
jgi:DegV family protein with EDD domain